MYVFGNHHQYHLSNVWDRNASVHSPSSLLRIQREVGELRCCERKLKKLVEMIKAPLADLGCEEAPPGCDLSLSLNILTPGILESNSETVSNEGNNFFKNRKQAQQVVHMIRKSFHRKASLPHSCMTTPLFSRKLVARRGTVEGGGRGLENAASLLFVNKYSIAEFTKWI
ncbi:hypothetical protein J437_LFUL014234 [Ladona fulva]|uniref:Uncharacterized protein n=1 Tax=Ladona fulva TaxID=123851 RepID=A0A8K0P872_LADFU|nr:hypothetical protein J437_LFUL014234 [Ladona fulva]